VWLAVENDLEIIPVINKIDLPAADPERVAREIEDVLGIDASNALLCSAKTGVGISEILEAIVKRIPPPPDRRAKAARALIFDSFYDQYLGVVCQFRVMDGAIMVNDTITFMNTGRSYPVTDLWVRAPDRVDVNSLLAGEVGCLAGAIKAVQDARVGDTITLRGTRAATSPLDGYAEAKPQVFCGLFPIDADDYQGLREALQRLQLNDAALSFEPEVSSAMGFGFRCGFLGMLHMDIVKERLEREHGLSLIMSAPTVVYRCDACHHTVMTGISP
jgi:elongation factor 4